MAYCGNCGHLLRGDSGFCSYCGAEHSADGELVVPEHREVDPEPPGTVPLPYGSETTAPMPPEPGPTVPRSQAQPAPSGAGSASQPASGQGRRSGSRWMVVAAIAVIIVACASVAAMVLLRHDGSGGTTASVSPSPSSKVRGEVEIMSPTNGNKVIGGQRMRVAVFATGVADLQGMQLVVNGVTTGPTKLGTGSGGSKTVSFPWRPPAKGGSVVLGVRVVLQDGSLVPTQSVRLVVRPATVPTPTVTITAQPAPTYDSGGGYESGSPDDFWAAMMCSKPDLSEAEDWATRARDAGFTNVRILNSSDYDSLHPGYWCAYLGPYGSRSSASEAVAELNARGLGGDHPYPSHVYNH
jgi:hypothetical protein